MAGRAARGGEGGVPRSRPRPAVADSPSPARAPHACRRFGAARAVREAGQRLSPHHATERHRAPFACRAPPSSRRLRAVDVASDEGRAEGLTSEGRGAKLEIQALGPRASAALGGAGREPACTGVRARGACAGGWRGG